MNDISESSLLPGRSKARAGESKLTHRRCNRFFQNSLGWFYSTREGIHMGPFPERSEALLSVMYYIERCQWSDLEHLYTYMDQRCFEAGARELQSTPSSAC